MITHEIISRWRGCDKDYWLGVAIVEAHFQISEAEEYTLKKGKTPWTEAFVTLKINKLKKTLSQDITKNVSYFKTFSYGIFTTPLITATNTPTKVLQSYNLGVLSKFKNINEVVFAMFPRTTPDVDILTRIYYTAKPFNIHSKNSISSQLNAQVNGVNAGLHIWGTNTPEVNVIQIIAARDRGNTSKNSTGGITQIDGNKNNFLFARDSKGYGTDSETFLGSWVLGNKNLCITKIWISDDATDMFLNIEYADLKGLGVTRKMDFKIGIIG